MATGRAAIISICEKYLQSLKDHDPSKIPFAPDVTITENGHVRVRGRAAARQLHKTEGKKVITGINVSKWVVEGDTAVAFYELDTSDGRLVMISEYFRVHDGQIREIKVNFGLGPTPE